jgi:hypothetical protein
MALLVIVTTVEQSGYLTYGPDNSKNSWGRALQDNGISWKCKSINQGLELARAVSFMDNVF